MGIPSLRKAIKIDVASRMVYEIEVKEGLQGMYDAIGNDCSMVEVAINFAPSRNQRYGDTLWVDEESYVYPERIKGGFSIGNSERMFANNAIVLGNVECSEGGMESSDYTLPIDLFRAHIQFFDADDVRDFEPQIQVISW